MTIKQHPEDFQVEEILTDEAASAIGQHTRRFVVYRLDKQRLTTPQATYRMAMLLRVDRDAVEFAGLKDRHAATSQHVTVDAGKFADKLPRKLSEEGWTATWLGFSDRPMTPHSIARNRFRIRVGDLSKRDVREMNAQTQRLASPGSGVHPSNAIPTSVRVVNYFGDQRFGSARHGQGFMAPLLIRGHFEDAIKLAIATPSRKDSLKQRKFKKTLQNQWGKWKAVLPRLEACQDRAAVELLAKDPKNFRAAFAALPQITQYMAVEAYQSWLWNAIAVELVVERCLPRGQVFEADDPFGNLFFPVASAIEDEMASLELPLLSPQTQLAPPWEQAARRVLEHERIEPKSLRIPGVDRPYFGHFLRPMFVDAVGFNMTDAAPDPDRQDKWTRTLSFELPRGAYATVVLRALGQ
ncbi:MAG: tRNA pseudouridine(13) synthase TruD [Phycisphaeraceae bacterium]|nr:tRNA pseudouridine(13) synthase TruD [Phycisphaeraceae bacterium]